MKSASLFKLLIFHWFIAWGKSPGEEVGYVPLTLCAASLISCVSRPKPAKQAKNDDTLFGTNALPPSWTLKLTGGCFAGYPALTSELSNRKPLINRTELRSNRPLALRGHVTNASFKQWVGILLMPKIDRAPEIWEETHLREIFYGSLIFQQTSMIHGIGRHVGGNTLALQHGGQNYHFCLYLVKRLIVTLRCVVNVTRSSTFPLRFKCKICVQKEVIQNFKNHILVRLNQLPTHF